MALLQVSDLVKMFGTARAVNGISLTLEAGRCATLLGPNGAGKSTTLRMLAGLLTPTSGSIRFPELSESEDIRSVIGYLPQYPMFYSWMSGREYLIYVGQLSRMSAKAAAQRADELLEEVGLSDSGKRRIGGYSGGMKQRLGLAQAMMHRPRLIILDEPVSALDPIGRREVLDRMKSLKKETTLLFSTHVLPDAEEITDDLFIMHKGEIVIAGALNEVMDEHRQPIIRIRGEQSLENLHAIFRTLDGVERVTGTGDHAELLVTDREQARDSVMRLLTDRGIPIRRLEISELTLEELFMKAVIK